MQARLPRCSPGCFTGRRSAHASGTPPLVLHTWVSMLQAMFASKVEMGQGDDLTVVREIDGGLETIRVGLPTILSTDLRLVERSFSLVGYASWANALCHPL